MTIVSVLIIIGLIGLDQLSKVWAVAVLSTGKEIKLWTNVFHLTYVENRGAAFGIFQGKVWFFIITTLIIVFMMIYYYRKIPHTFWGKWTRFSLVMIISGAIGNLIDRVVLNYVRDFLYFILIDFPVFNIADILVVVGVGILLLIMLLGDDEILLKKEGIDE